MLSIVIPCYNCVTTIKRAIESVLNQKYPHYELLLIDNRSTDGTIHILNYYKDQYPGQVRVYHEANRGAPAARNKGLRLAVGEWVQFLDADDELHPEKISTQLELVRNSNAAIVVGNYIQEWTRGNKRIHMKRAAMTDPWEGLITSNLGITSSNLWRRSDVLAVDGWDERLTSSQEYDLMFRMLKNQSAVVFDPSYHTVVYFNDNSTSKSTQKKRLIQIVQNRIDLRCEIKEFLVQNHLLTARRNRRIDTYIYFELKRNSPEILEYVNEYLKQNPLDVPWNTMLKINSRVALRRSWQAVRDLFYPGTVWDSKRNIS